MAYKREEIPQSFYKKGGKGWNADSIKLGLHTLLNQVSKEYLRRFSLPLWSPDTTTSHISDVETVVKDLTPPAKSVSHSFQNHFAAAIVARCRYINEDDAHSYPTEDEFEAIVIAFHSNIVDTLSRGQDAETSEEDYVIEARRILDGIEADVTDAADRIVDKYIVDDSLKSRSVGEASARGIISQNITGAACQEIDSYRADLNNEYTHLRHITHQIEYNAGNSVYCDIFALQLALLFHKIREIYPYWKPRLEDCSGSSRGRDAFHAYEEYGEAELLDIMESQLVQAVQYTFDQHWKPPETNFLDSMWAEEDNRNRYRLILK